MPWEFEPDRPIYLQLMEHIKMKIVSGEYAPGARLASVRELAAEAAVNPNTMQKAMTELERSGLVFAQRTSGRFITEDGELIKKLRLETARAEAADFLTRLRGMGFSAAEAAELLLAVAPPEGAEEADC